MDVNISYNVALGIYATGHASGSIANSWVWGADHSIWSMEPMTEDHAEVGVLVEDTPGPIAVFGLMSEHHHEAMIALRNATFWDSLIIQTEQAVPIENATSTVHLELSGGSSNVTIYGALSCNWWSPPVTSLATAFGLGTGVSVFGLKDRGSPNGGIQQPNTPGLPLPKSGDGWYNLLVDLNIPSQT